MKGRPTLLMGLLFALFAGGLWYFDLSKPIDDFPEEDSLEVELLTDVDWSELSRVELELGAQPVVLERRAPGSGESAVWRVIEPIDAPVDETALESVLEALEELAAEPVTSVAEHGLTPFGLDAGGARVRMTFESAAGAGSSERILRIGADAPVGYQVYVHVVGSPDIHATPVYLRTTLDKSPFELRRKKIARFSALDVESLSLQRDGQQVSLERRDRGWDLVHPIRARADVEQVDDLIDGITALRATRFIDSGSSDGAQGFEAPLLTISVRLEAAGASRTEDMVFADAPEVSDEITVRSGGDIVELAVVAARALERIDKDLEELRDRRVVVFDRGAIGAVEIRGAEVDLRVVRDLSAVGEAGPWRLEDAGAEPRQVDQANVNQMLITLAALQVERFLDGTAAPSPGEAGMLEPHLVIRLLGAEDQERVKLAVGSRVSVLAPAPDDSELDAGASGTDQRYVRVSGEAGMVVVTGAFLSDVPEVVADILLTPDGA